MIRIFDGKANPIPFTEAYRHHVSALGIYFDLHRVLIRSMIDCPPPPVCCSLICNEIHGSTYEKDSYGTRPAASFVFSTRPFLLWPGLGTTTTATMPTEQAQVYNIYDRGMQFNHATPSLFCTATRKLTAQLKIMAAGQRLLRDKPPLHWFFVRFWRSKPPAMVVAGLSLIYAPCVNEVIADQIRLVSKGI